MGNKKSKPLASRRIAKSNVNAVKEESKKQSISINPNNKTPTKRSVDVIPRTIHALKQRLAFFGVSQNDLKRFQAQIDEEGYNLEIIRQDICEAIEESALADSFKDTYQAKETLYYLIQSILAGDLHKCFQHSLKGKLSWYNMVECLKHEISNAAGKALEYTIGELVANSQSFDLKDLSDDAVDRVIKNLVFNRKLSGKEVTFIQGMVNRARTFQKGFGGQLFIS